jgi:hypothetical protein
MEALNYYQIQVPKRSSYKLSLNVPRNGNVYHNFVDGKLPKHSILGKSKDDRFSPNVVAQLSCDTKFVFIV